MTKRSDIIDGSMAASRRYGLIYTKRCGWVDLGHANGDGARILWNQINNETGNPSLTHSGYHIITYRQMMGNRYVKIGIYKRYEILKGMTDAEKRSVALSIFLAVSKDFESFQGNWFFRHFTNSSFSAEDLVSDLIGFYRAVYPTKQFLQTCEPVSKDIALKIWDTYGAVGDNKNKSIIPYLYPLPGVKNSGPMSAPLPKELNTIVPAKQGKIFREIK